MCLFCLHISLFIHCIIHYVTSVKHTFYALYVLWFLNENRLHFLINLNHVLVRWYKMNLFIPAISRITHHVPEMPHSCRLKHFSYFDSDYCEYTNSRFQRRLKTTIEYCVRKYTIQNIIITLLLCARGVLTSHDSYEK